MWRSLFGPPGISDYASQVDRLTLFLGGLSALFVLIVWALAAVFSLRYAATDDRRPSSLPSASGGLLALGILAPLAFTLIVFAWGTRIEASKSDVPPLAQEVVARARQWMWTFEHEDGRKEINALHVPVGVPVVLELESADVLHRLSLPALRIQGEIIPGTTQRVWFQADREGSYALLCTEFCGTGHSTMAGTLYVLDPITYEHWVTGVSASLTPQQAGELLFGAFRCDSCHAPSGEGTGPSLVGRFGVDTEFEDGSSALFDGPYVRESLLEPQSKLAAGFQPVMPSYKGQLDESQIAQIIAYLESLSDG